MSVDPKVACQLFADDLRSYDLYGYSYSKHMNNIIDELIEYQGYLIKTGQFDHRDNEVHKVMVSQEQTMQLIKEDVPPVVTAGPSGDTAGVIASRPSVRNVNFPDKQWGYIALEPTDFTFIGPNREPYKFSSITSYFCLADLIKHTGLPNYRGARVPLQSSLNIDAWRRLLQDYLDKLIMGYLEFGFPLSISFDNDLCNVEVINHYSARIHPTAVEAYIQNELQQGSMLGPTTVIPSHQFHVSPLLTRPKDVDRRCIILDLSYPAGGSLNDLVEKTL